MREACSASQRLDTISKTQQVDGLLGVRRKGTFRDHHNRVRAYLQCPKHRRQHLQQKVEVPGDPHDNGRLSHHWGRPLHQWNMADIVPADGLLQ